MTPKRTRSDSAASAVKAMLNAAKDDLRPPAHVRLRDGDEPFWVGVVRARARDEWTEADLMVAALVRKYRLPVAESDIEWDFSINEARLAQIAT